MKNTILSLMALGSLSSSVFGAATLTPLSTFGGGDGWLSPEEYPILGTGNTTRGLAYNPATGNLIVASRTGGTFLKALSGSNGSEVAGLDTTGISGGTFPINMVTVSNDGAIFVGNLVAPAAGGPGSDFKIYRYANQGAAPAVWYQGQPVAGTVAGQANPTSIRTGDSLDIFGTGNALKIVAGHGTNPLLPGSNSYSIFQDADGDATASVSTIDLGTATPSGEFRLGITFGLDDATVVGSVGTNGRLTTYSGTTGTLAGSVPFGAGERGLDVALVGGLPVLATLDSNNSLVRVYDVSSPLTPTLLASANATSGTLAGNTNGTVAVAWGAIDGASAKLYAMSTNQGIQAFTFTVPEPTTAAFAALGLLGLLRRRR